MLIKTRKDQLRNQINFTCGKVMNIGLAINLLPVDIR